MSNEPSYSFLICSFAAMLELLSAQKALKETSKSLGFDCSRVDEFQHNGQIINQIYESIFGSSFVIGDMTEIVRIVTTKLDRPHTDSLSRRFFLQAFAVAYPPQT